MMSVDVKYCISLVIIGLFFRVFITLFITINGLFAKEITLLAILYKTV